MPSESVAEIAEGYFERLRTALASAPLLGKDHVLARLDEIYQAPVALFYLQDCSYNEIAEILAIPLGTVKSRLTRGLGRLHRMLSDKPSL